MSRKEDKVRTSRIICWSYKGVLSYSRKIFSKMKHPVVSRLFFFGSPQGGVQEMGGVQVSRKGDVIIRVLIMGVELGVLYCMFLIGIVAGCVSKIMSKKYYGRAV